MSKGGLLKLFRESSYYCHIYKGDHFLQVIFIYKGHILAFFMVLKHYTYEGSFTKINFASKLLYILVGMECGMGHWTQWDIPKTDLIPGT